MTSTTLSVTMLGAGQEVGRSCCVLKHKGITVVCDAGIHPAQSGIASLPFIDALDWSTVDAILITHFHLDHTAALTYIMEKTNFRDGRGKVYMTHPTKAIYKLIMRDFVRISETSTKPFFTSLDLANSLLDIIPISVHQLVTPFPDLSFIAYHAGHVIGACMFMVEISDLKILYTGDYSREETRHLPKAGIPPIRPDVLIIESTHGVQNLENRDPKETRFTDLVHQIIQRSGHVLLPVFALGQAQELMLVLEAYWRVHPELHCTPIYYVSNMANKSLAVYQAYMHTLNADIRNRFARGDNPFVFRHITHLPQNHNSVKTVANGSPCVILATPGMLQSGTSRELFELWAPDIRNGVVITGYSTEGTLAKDIIRNRLDEITSLEGKTIPCRLLIEEIPFSAHVDFTQNVGFIEQIHARHIVLVHGERHGMGRLKNALENHLVSHKEDVEVHMPRNLEPLLLEFETKKNSTKVLGNLALADPKNNAILSGLLVSDKFSSMLLDPEDLHHLSGISAASIIQKQKLFIQIEWSLIVEQLEIMFGPAKTSNDNSGEVPETHYQVMETVEVQKTGPFELTLKWTSTSFNDMIADAVIAFLLSMWGSPPLTKITKPCEHNILTTNTTTGSGVQTHSDRLEMLFRAHFGEAEVHREGGNTPGLKVTTNGADIYIDLESLSVTCSDDTFRKRAREVLELAMISSRSLQDVVPMPQ